MTTPRGWRAASRDELLRRSLDLPPHPQLRALDGARLRDAAGVDEFASFQPSAWFGPTDDRRDPARVPGLPRALKRLARRVCYLIGSGAARPDGPQLTRLYYAGYGEYHSLCRDEPFWDQPCVIERDGEAYGGIGYTGLLIAPDRVLTCWHGWSHFDYRPRIAVFGYAMSETGSARSAVERRRAEIVAIEPYPVAEGMVGEDRAGSGQLAAGNDWMVLRLARPVSADVAPSEPLQLGSARAGQAVYTLGYPCGLPLKLADRAHVLSAGPVDDPTFRANLDTFVGNSGSPVFDARDHSLLGLVVESQKGAGDFEPVPSRGCYITRRVERHVVGQVAVSASAFAKALPLQR
jgi:V8-like Glu-specific endopeptidase